MAVATSLPQPFKPIRVEGGIAAPDADSLLRGSVPVGWLGGNGMVSQRGRHKNDGPAAAAAQGKAVAAAGRAAAAAGASGAAAVAPPAAAEPPVTLFYPAPTKVRGEELVRGFAPPHWPLREVARFRRL